MTKIDLSGTWTLTCSKADFQAIPAQIPGDNCTALIEAGIASDPNIGFNERDIQWVRKYTWTWTRRVDVSKDFLKQKRIWLNVESFDTIGEIRINGKTAVTSRNMFCRIRQDVKEFLREGENTIEAIITPVEEYTTAVEDKLTFKLGAKSYYRFMPNLNLARKIQCQGGWDWGICMPVSGLYGEVYLEGSNGVWIEHAYTEQAHKPGECLLNVTAEIDSDFDGEQAVEFKFNGETKTVTAELRKGLNQVETSFTVKNPKLWYPAGYGEHPLYDLEVAADSCRIRKRIGLRDLKTVSHPDEHGICLYFQVNGIDIFAKGADWIPMDSRPQTYTRERYDRLLSDAVEANMNALRVWGGGLYENEDFYDLCDEKGILLWQDGMFACAHYPAIPEFLESVAQELNYQIKRLRDHASIALWCGDNECGQFLRSAGPKELPWTLNYDRFNQAVGKAVAAADKTRVFWPTSPCNSQWDASGWDDDSQGDMHFWKVWHSGAPFEEYYKIEPRFCSEFGFQAFPTQNTVDFYTQGKQRNVTSPLMEFHQRNNGGNSKIVEMFTRYFRLPATFEDFIYLSQVQQAVAIKTGVEFWRTLKPLCMGTIYWQLNDNWPVASWASLDFFGSWKQLHYHAKRFYAPVMAAAIRKTPETVEVRMSSDLGGAVRGELTLEVRGIEGEVRSSRKIKVDLAAYSAGVLETIPVSELSSAPDQEFLYLELQGECEGRSVCFTNECFLAKYKEYQMSEPGIRSRLYRDEQGVMHLALTAEKAAFYVLAEFRGIQAVFSDNSFTLLPDKPRDLTFRTDSDIPLETLEKALVIRHLQGCSQE